MTVGYLFIRGFGIILLAVVFIREIERSFNNANHHSVIEAC